MGCRRMVVGGSWVLHEMVKQFNSIILYSNLKIYDMRKVKSLVIFQKMDRFVYELGWININVRVNDVSD